MTCLVDKLILNQKVKDEVEAKCDKDDPVVVYCLKSCCSSVIFVIKLTYVIGNLVTMK